MRAQSYKESLVNALKVLTDAENQIFTAMVNLGFNGEYADISKLHEEGEVLNLELAMFENTNDENLNQFSLLVKTIIQVRITLMDLNAINEEELEID